MLDDPDEKFTAALGARLESNLRSILRLPPGTPPPLELEAEIDDPRQDCLAAAAHYCHEGFNPLLYARIVESLDRVVPNLRIASSGHIFLSEKKPETDTHEPISQPEQEAIYRTIARKLRLSVASLVETKARGKSGLIKPVGMEDYAVVIEGWVRDAYENLPDEVQAAVDDEQMLWRLEVPNTHHNIDLFTPYRTKKIGTPGAPRKVHRGASPDWDRCYDDLKAAYPVIKKRLEEALDEVLLPIMQPKGLSYTPAAVSLHNRPPRVEAYWGGHGDTLEEMRTQRVLTPIPTRLELDNRVDDICATFGLHWKPARRDRSSMVPWFDDPFCYTLMPHLEPYTPRPRPK